jgi:hypothetical protein
MIVRGWLFRKNIKQVNIVLSTPPNAWTGLYIPLFLHPYQEEEGIA